MLKLAILLGAVASCTADLRMASQPKRSWKVKNRNTVKFVSEQALYMEPSVFGYKGLVRQRDGGGYDQFLRSNIDNEQDKRNFNNEPGKDHLPFRSYEASMTDAGQDPDIKRELGEKFEALAATIQADPGTPFLVPLRWNNPHAAELEVNIWIMENKYVVPIAKPQCSGEGRQDQVFTFTVPADFNKLGEKVKDFAGCKKIGDCVLQIYAHSVESRQYSMGTPLIVSGDVPAATATDETGITKRGEDPGLTLTPLRAICLPRNDPAVDITSAVPQHARLVSDVYNHAYQNSDYSPYAGQQPAEISRNLQASVILKMVPANRGELGRALLKKENPKAYYFAKSLLKKADRMIRKYESITNKIISKLDDTVKTTEIIPANNNIGQPQPTANCFLCAESGSVTTRRQKTNTYVPSFLIAPENLETAKNYVPDKYANLINEKGELQIYLAALEAMETQFVKASTEYGLNYLPPAMKSTTTTMADEKNFIKKDANGRSDRGVYAATQARAAGPVQLPVTAGIWSTKFQAADPGLVDALEPETPDLPDSGAEPVATTPDMDALMSDSNCDDDELWTEDLVCDTGTRMFEVPEDIDADLGAASSVKATPWLAGLALVFALLF